MSQPSGADLVALNASFRRILRAENKSERTVAAYTDAVRLLAEFLAQRGDSLTVTAITRDHIAAFIGDQLDRLKPATAHNRYRGLRAFFKWAVNEGELRVSPMVGMNPPQIPEEPPPVLGDDQLRRLLKACEGRDFPARRDTAIIRLLMDTGVRVSECAGIMLDDLDLDDQVVRVLGKGSRERLVPFGRKTTLALDRYLRARTGQPHAHLPNLWIGRAGAITPSGVYQVVADRGASVGLRLHPHQLRHTFADSWLGAGGTEGDLMRLAGWKSRAMLDRYAKATAERRAREAYRRMTLGDRI
jgi:site-specific recombinase XerD